MARLGQRTLNTISVLIDIAIVVASMGMAFFLRFHVFFGVTPPGTVYDHMLWAAAISPVYVFLYGLLGVYSQHALHDTTRTLGRVIAADTIGAMLFIDCVFIFRMIDVSRWLIVMFWLLTVVLSCAKVVLADWYVRARHRRGLGRRRILVVGAGAPARMYSDGVAREGDEGLEVVGNIGDVPLSSALPRLGGYGELSHILETRLPDEIVVALDTSEQRLLDGILLECERSGIKVSVLPAFWQYFSRPHVSIEGGMPLIDINHVALDNMGLAFVKRAIDVVGSLALIVLTSPIMLAAVIGVRLSSPGPIVFKQLRVGRGRRTFYMYKFRSMRVNDEQDTAWTSDGDPRRTRFGALIRHYSIDELPQLFNVLRGDMSLVGPRPELPQHVERFQCSVPLYMVRHQVRPGMTGWAQVNGLRGDTSIEKRVEYDLHYINNWSLLFDLHILLLTPLRGVVNKQESLMGKDV